MKSKEIEIDSFEISDKGDHRKMLGWTVSSTQH